MLARSGLRNSKPEGCKPRVAHFACTRSCRQHAMSEFASIVRPVNYDETKVGCLILQFRFHADTARINAS